MKTTVKKSLCFLIGLFILFSFNCYAAETLSAQQKEAKEWFEKAEDTDTLELKIEYCTKAIELDPKTSNAYYSRAAAYSSLGQYQKAIDDYSKVIKTDNKEINMGVNPDYFLKLPVYISRGDIYSSLGQYQKAIDDYSKAIELDSEFFSADDIYLSRGLSYIMLGQHQKAIDDFTKAIEIDPKSARAYYGRGFAIRVLGEFQKAIDDFTKVIEIDPKSAIAYYNRGNTYLIRKFPTVACGDYYQAGILYLKQNNTTEALICVDLMKKADPSSPLINKLMGQIYK